MAWKKRKPPTATRPLQQGDEAWAYLRVSTLEQVERGLPIAEQRHEVESYCSARGYRLTRVYADEGRSGGDHDRDAFQEMAAEAQRLHPAAIVFWRWDRFSRANVIEAAKWRITLRSAGIHLVSITDPVPDMGGLEVMIEDAIAFQNNQYLQAISEASKRGLRHLAEAGYFPGHFHCMPRGYQVIADEITVSGQPHRVWRIELDPATVPLVRRAWEMRAAGATYREISASTHLYADHASWQGHFANPMYMGRLTWGHTSVAVPAIVSPEEWAAMQRLQATNRARHHPRRVASAYLLSGIAICGLCGRPLRGQVRHTVRDYRYYMCSHASEPRCPLPGVRAEALDGAVVAWLAANVLSDDAIAIYREQLADTSSGARQLAAARVAQAERQWAECESAITNLVRAIEVAPNNGHLVARLEERTREAKRLRSEAEVARAGLDVGGGQAADVGSLRASLETGLRGEHVPQARAVIAMLLESVTVYSREECLIAWRSWPFVPSAALSPHKATVGIISPPDARQSNGRGRNVRRPSGE